MTRKRSQPEVDTAFLVAEAKRELGETAYAIDLVGNNYGPVEIEWHPRYDFRANRVVCEGEVLMKNAPAGTYVGIRLDSGGKVKNLQMMHSPVVVLGSAGSTDLAIHVEF